MTASTAAPALVERLEREGVAFELLHHPRTETAAAEAAALGVSTDDVAKTLVLETPEGFVRAVIPASERLDLRRVKELLGTREVELATEQVLAGAYPEFELGAVPPFAGPDGDRVLVDRRVAERESVVLEAGSHEESVRLGSGDLVTLAAAQVADLRRE